MIYYSKRHLTPQVKLSEAAATKSKDIVKVIESLPMLQKGTPATEEQIKKAEKDLSLKFAEDYKTYLRTFGFINAQGMEITGICSYKEYNVVDATKREWEVNTQVKHDMYLIENYYIDGILVWQDKSGKIWESRPFRDPFITENSLVEFFIDEEKALTKMKKGKK